MPPRAVATPRPALQRPFAVALGLSMGAAVSLGVARFSYALLLPPMRDDLAWSYLLAGGMNTANALGYLLGALATPGLMHRHGLSRVLVGGSVLTSVLMMASGWFTGSAMLLLLRLAAGIASALVFIAGGVLAARLAGMVVRHGGLLLALYYGGTGFGITLSALAVPAAGAGAVAAALPGFDWQWAWLALGLACAAATVWLAWAARMIAGQEADAPTASHSARIAWKPLAPALGAYFLFGMGYIGYMTFVVALLREHGLPATAVTLFYALLGAAVVASPVLWSRLMQRHRGGRPMAVLCALLALAGVLPALTAHPLVLFASGIAFGAIFLQVPGATTALVRHNLPASQWAAGISAFTIVFAFGQIVGPTLVGWVADGPGGLSLGFIGSAAALAIGALLASMQRPLGNA